MLDEDDSQKKKKKTIWSRVASGVDGVIEAPLQGSIVGDCISTGSIINIADAYADDRFDADVDKQTGFRTRAVLAVPVQDEDGKVIGAIQMINKKSDGDSATAAATFGDSDIRLVEMLCNHVACFIRVVNAG